MLTRILHNSEKLCTFLDQLDIELSQPQCRHLLNMADALLVCEDRGKATADLTKYLEIATDPYWREQAQKQLDALGNGE